MKQKQWDFTQAMKINTGKNSLTVTAGNHKAAS